MDERTQQRRRSNLRLRMQRFQKQMLLVVENDALQADILEVDAQVEEALANTTKPWEGLRPVVF